MYSLPKVSAGIRQFHVLLFFINIHINSQYTRKTK